MSVGRNGSEAGTVKTRGITVSSRAGQDRGLRLGDCPRGAYMDPQPVEAQSVQSAGCGGAVEQEAQRERPVRGRLEQGGRKDCDAGVDEGDDLPLRARREPPVGTQRKIAAAFDPAIMGGLRLLPQPATSRGYDCRGEPIEIGRDAL